MSSYRTYEPRTETFQRRPATAEDGVMFWLLAIFASVMLMIGLLILDYSAVYRAQNVMQRAADAAALRAASLLPMGETERLASEDSVLAIAEQIALDNILANEKLFSGGGDINAVLGDDWIEFNIDTTDGLVVGVDIELDLPTYLMNKTPWSGDVIRTAARAEATRDNVVVVVVVDNSYSMNKKHFHPTYNPFHSYASQNSWLQKDPGVDFNGESTTSDGLPAINEDTTRSELMKSALSSFLDKMEAKRVPVILTLFSEGAERVSREQLMASSPGPYTNMYSGIEVGHNELIAAVEEQEEGFAGMENAERLMIVIGDGNPTIGKEENTGGDRDKLQNAVVNLTDKLRIDHDYTIFSMGLGTPNPNADNSLTPYLEPTKSLFLSPIFMRRIANDPQHQYDAQFEVTDNSFDEVRYHRPGAAFVDPNEIDDMFTYVGDYIRERLLK